MLFTSRVPINRKHATPEENNTMVTTIKSEIGFAEMKTKDKIHAAKRPTKKKPKDKPKRPLSAYNFFFKEEREKILKVVNADDPMEAQKDKDPEAEDYLDTEAIGRLKKEGGKVSFEEMGKIIGQRWKNIDPDRLSKFSEMAAEDTERYKTEMASYNARQESKMRNELKAPPVSYPPLGAASSMDRGGPPSQQSYPGIAPMYGSPGGYDPSGYSMGAPAAMGGYGGYSDFSGYGMGMGGYGMPESAASMHYGNIYGQPMDGQPGLYGAGAYSMGGMMGGYPGAMMGYDQYGQPMDGSGPPGVPGPYSSYAPQGSWGQG
ncbi:HMG high mobility group box-containing protein [Nitzschia inconspicua]|uniref:HMG high mobility group box-containing protein n=1 Tax=Nitzschia inconspicua TaxID=303405 RepID=A0A9K3KN57_9STRA|nr:HMG high mobility group box-containing protein [Nitzschia inconspicua]